MNQFWENRSIHTNSFITPQSLERLMTQLLHWGKKEKGNFDKAIKMPLEE